MFTFPQIAKANSPRLQGLALQTPCGVLRGSSGDQPYCRAQHRVRGLGMLKIFEQDWKLDGKTKGSVRTLQPFVWRFEEIVQLMKFLCAAPPIAHKLLRQNFDRKTWAGVVRPSNVWSTGRANLAEKRLNAPLSFWFEGLTISGRLASQELSAWVLRPLFTVCCKSWTCGGLTTCSQLFTSPSSLWDADTSFP